MAEPRSEDLGPTLSDPSVSFSRKKGLACFHCRKAHRRCDGYPGKVCKRCTERKLSCSYPQNRQPRTRQLYSFSPSSTASNGETPSDVGSTSSSSEEDSHSVRRKRRSRRSSDSPPIPPRNRHDITPPPPLRRTGPQAGASSLVLLPSLPSRARLTLPMPPLLSGMPLPIPRPISDPVLPRSYSSVAPRHSRQLTPQHYHEIIRFLTDCPQPLHILSVREFSALFPRAVSVTLTSDVPSVPLRNMSVDHFRENLAVAGLVHALLAFITVQTHGLHNVKRSREFESLSWLEFSVALDFEGDPSRYGAVLTRYVELALEGEREDSGRFSFCASFEQFQSFEERVRYLHGCALLSLAVFRSITGTLSSALRYSLAGAGQLREFALFRRNAMRHVLSYFYWDVGLQYHLSQRRLSSVGLFSPCCSLERAQFIAACYQKYVSSDTTELLSLSGHSPPQDQADQPRTFLLTEETLSTDVGQGLLASQLTLVSGAVFFDLARRRGLPTSPQDQEIDCDLVFVIQRLIDLIRNRIIHVQTRHHLLYGLTVHLVAVLRDSGSHTRSEVLSKLHESMSHFLSVGRFWGPTTFVSQFISFLLLGNEEGQGFDPERCGRTLKKMKNESSCSISQSFHFLQLLERVSSRQHLGFEFQQLLMDLRPRDGEWTVLKSRAEVYIVSQVRRMGGEERNEERRQRARTRSDTASMNRTRAWRLWNADLRGPLRFMPRVSRSITSED